MKTIISRIKEASKTAVYLNSYVTVKSFKEVKVENATKILDCNEILVKIKTTDCDLLIWGEGLECSSYNYNIISVSGIIKSIELEAKK